MHINHVSNVTLLSNQQMSIKYHKSKCKNVHHLHKHMLGDTIHFPTKQCIS